jgi:hypothetical protein
MPESKHHRATEAISAFSHSPGPSPACARSNTAAKRGAARRQRALAQSRFEAIKKGFADHLDYHSSTTKRVVWNTRIE